MQLNVETMNKKWLIWISIKIEFAIFLRRGTKNSRNHIQTGSQQFWIEAAILERFQRSYFNKHLEGIH